MQRLRVQQQHQHQRRSVTGARREERARVYERRERASSTGVSERRSRGTACMPVFSILSLSLFPLPLALLLSSRLCSRLQSAAALAVSEEHCRSTAAAAAAAAVAVAPPSCSHLRVCVCVCVCVCAPCVCREQSQFSSTLLSPLILSPLLSSHSARAEAAAASVAVHCQSCSLVRRESEQSPTLVDVCCTPPSARRCCSCSCSSIQA